MAMLCKSWSETCLDEALWRNLVQRDWSTAQLPLVELPEKVRSTVVLSIPRSQTMLHAWHLRP